MQPYQPLVESGHWLTILSNFWPRPLDTTQFPLLETVYQTEPDVRVLVREHHPPGIPKGEIILVHGLEGSSESGYMRSFAHYACTAGWRVHRTNIRTCGPTEDWCNTLYHAGLTSDLKFIVRELARQGRGPLYIIGYSLGGNQVLKATAELSDESPGIIAGTCSVCTPIDLALCSRKIEHPSNFIYMNRFLRSMKARLRRRSAMFPGAFSLHDLDEVRTIWQIDNQVTARHFGFGTAENYYSTQSAGVHIDRVKTPTMMVAAEDDPIVPINCYDNPVVAANPNLKFVPVRRGGHVSFLSRTRPRFWLDHFLLEWLEQIGNKRG